MAAVEGLAVRFRPTLTKNLADPVAEQVRRSQADAIRELQDRSSELAGAGGRLLGSPRKFTTSGTYHRTAGTKLAIFELTGGGGAGGSAQGGAGGAAVGGGGASGTTILFAVANPVDGVITIGSAGAPGATGNNPGGNGGDSTLVQGSITWTAKGGGGGGGMANGGIVVSSAGAPLAGSSLGDWFAAESGRMGLFFSGSTWASGSGGSGARGIGGTGQVGSIAAAAAGTGYGAGGAGAAVTTVSASGAAGTLGVLLVWELS